MDEKTPTTIRECLAQLDPTQLSAFVAGMSAAVELHQEYPAITVWLGVLRTAAEVEERTRNGNPDGSLTYWEAALMKAAADLSDSDIERLLPIHRAQFNGNAEIPFKTPISLIAGVCVICLQLELERRSPLVA